MWALGELIDRAPAAVGPHLPVLLSRLRRLLARAHDPALLRNTAITLARMAPLCAAPLAEALPDTGPYWLAPLAQVRAGHDRDRSHAAALSLFTGNPTAALAQLPRLCALIFSWGAGSLPPVVREPAVKLFTLLRSSPDFADRWKAVPEEMRNYCQKVLA